MLLAVCVRGDAPRAVKNLARGGYYWRMSDVPSRAVVPARLEPARDVPAAVSTDETTCPHCGESRELAKVKGCIRCLRCGFKFDCNGW